MIGCLVNMNIPAADNRVVQIAVLQKYPAGIITSMKNGCHSLCRLVTANLTTLRCPLAWALIGICCLISRNEHVD
jgi:hypothetical protein